MTQHETIVCERLVLKDTTGQIRAELGIDAEQSSVSLTLIDQDGHERASILQDREGVSLRLFDKDGNSRLLVGLLPDEDETVMAMMLGKNHDGNPSAAVRVSADGEVEMIPGNGQAEAEAAQKKYVQSLRRLKQ